MSGLLFYLWLALAAQAQEFLQFEGRQTHPIRLSEDGQRLYVLNTPDGRLSVFDVSNPTNPQPILIAEIPVGLEPVSIAERTADEVWVVNEVSDTVSVVSISRRLAVAHLKTGDEPADVVFAGGRAFVTGARDNAVRVYDAKSHQRLADIQLEALFPRAMAVGAGGEKLYVAAQMSGNKTTILPADLAPDPPEPTNPELGPAPKTGLIVPDSDAAITYEVLDNDVAVIDVATLAVDRYLSGVGTTLFDLALNPDGTEIWVANTEALNHIRFEPELRGHFIDNRVTQIDLATGVATPLELNTGIDYDVLPNPAAQASAIAQPTAIVFEPGGSHLWVAGFGSDIVARVDALTGAVVGRVDVGPELAPMETSRPAEKRGPRGLALDHAGRRLFVLNRLSNTVSSIDIEEGAVYAEVPAGSHDPTPEAVKRGRGFLYDARLSGNGTNSCASCHIDGDRDGLGWDLGDPGGEMVFIEGENRVNHDTAGNDQAPVKEMRALHPMKGPKVTQTLRGMLIDPIVVADPQVPGGISTREPLFHWRGDKKTLDEFNATFDNLMGGSMIPEAEFGEFKAFLRSMQLHPNPHRNLDRSTPAEIAGGDPVKGRANFLNHGLSHCAVCHPVPSGTDQNIDEFNNSSTVDFVKTPALMLSYQKQGTFSPGKGTSLSGFGFGHDGTGQALPLPHFYFLSTMDVPQLIDTRAFVLAFDSITAGTSPAVGHVLSVDSTNAMSAEVAATLDVLESHADPALQDFNQYWNDVVATGVVGGESCKLRYDGGSDLWVFDRSGKPPVGTAELLSLIGDADRLNFFGVPVGYGVRVGGDRNQNGILDGDEGVPQLDVESIDGNVRITWDDVSTGWTLESVSDLRSWSALNLQREAGDPGFTVSDPEAGLRKFYRLRRTW
ncbi:MAG: hypothetical protein ACR2RV_02210 [Verrucomicrobiales bacterium]